MRGLRKGGDELLKMTACEYLKAPIILLILVCVCVNLASMKLGLYHDGVSTLRPVLLAPLGAAVNKD